MDILIGRAVMRLAPIPPQELSADQRALYDDMKAVVNKKFSSFRTMSADGAFLGPWNTWIHEPELGSAFWHTTKAVARCAVLPDRVRQIAILVVGAHFNAAYELYAHSAEAKKDGLTDSLISTLVAGSRPEGMTDEEGVAYDLAFSLSAARRLPEDTYRRALSVFGQRGTNELVFLVAYYCFVSVVLNGFDVPVPED
jgi:4-carboxymuconolactone decarboxylase